MSVIIEQKDLNSIISVSSFNVKIANIILNTSCDLIVSLYDLNYKLLRQDILTLQNNDYLNWGNDDNYIIDYVKNHYGFETSNNEIVPIE